MNYSDIISEYLDILKSDYETASVSGEATPELSFRGGLDRFFKQLTNEINPDIAVIHEPTNQQQLGRPDWRFHDTETMGVYGYVEAKGFDPEHEIDVTSYIPQVDKYLGLGHKVLLTDGVDFVLFSPDNSPPEHFSVTHKPVNWQTLRPITETETIFRQFFAQPGHRNISEDQLIEEVAKRARLLTKDVESLVTLNPDEAASEQEETSILCLKDLHLILETQHDLTLQSHQIFASFVAQVLTFGLLYAHRITRTESDNPYDRYTKIHDFWSGQLHQDYAKELQPFRELILQLDDELESSLSRLGTWYDDTRRLLAHVQLSASQMAAPDYHTLYESFLAIYDPDTRFDFGAFYTPPELAAYLVSLTEAVSEVYFQDYKLYDPDTKIIDPCCGTGTFIEQLLSRYGEQRPQTIGFEILPAPYALAHYRMIMTGGKTYPNNTHIVLTNTLSDALERDISTENEQSSLMLAEQQRAHLLSRPPLTVIIGNPPSSDSGTSTTHEGDRIKTLLDDFRPPPEQRRQRSNSQKQIGNEFMKFLRWACDKSEQSKPAILSLVLPSSFARHSSYKYARKWVAERFSAIWVLEFDSDNRTGTGDSNLFNTLQGRLLLVGVIKDDSDELDCRMFLASITGRSKEEKRAYFIQMQSSESILEDFRESPLDNDAYSLRPPKSYDKSQYMQFWPLCADDCQTDEDNYVFHRHISGIKLAPTHLLAHADKGQLRRRSREISNQNMDYETIRTTWYSGIRKPPSATKITDNVRRLLGIAAADDARLRSYAYRPFVNAHAVLDDELFTELESLGGRGTRGRPELRAAYDSDYVVGIAVAPGPEDLGERLHRFVSFCWHPPDNDIVARGNGHVFCNYFPLYKQSRVVWDSTPLLNVNRALTRRIETAFTLSSIDASKMIVFYTYGILCSELFLEKYEEVLFTPAGEYPRLPVVEDIHLFRSIADIGQRLAATEHPDYTPVDCELFSCYENLFDSEFRLNKIYYDITQENIQLIDTSGVARITMRGVPKEILGLEVSGHKVLVEWIKIHSYPYLRTTFRERHYREFLQVLCGIQEQLRLIIDLDELLISVFEGPTSLLNP